MSTLGTSSGVSAGIHQTQTGSGASAATSSSESAAGDSANTAAADGATPSTWKSSSGAAIAGVCAAVVGIVAMGVVAVIRQRRRFLAPSASDTVHSLQVPSITPKSTATVITDGSYHITMPTGRDQSNFKNMGADSATAAGRAAIDSDVVDSTDTDVRLSSPSNQSRPDETEPVPRSRPRSAARSKLNSHRREARRIEKARKMKKSSAGAGRAGTSDTEL